MISSVQVLLARTLLKLSQKEAAKLLGINPATLSNIETGESDPPASRLLQLQRFYENEGVEFLDGNGVREARSYLQHYHGIEEFRAFMDDVYETAKEYGGDICLFNSKPSLWLKLLGEDWYKWHGQRMKALKDSIRVRITVQEGEQFFILDFAEHRWFSKDFWKGKVIYAYGPKLGFLDFSENSVHIMVLNQPDFAESFKVLFDIAWQHIAIVPPVKGVKDNC